VFYNVGILTEVFEIRGVVGVSENHHLVVQKEENQEHQTVPYLVVKGKVIRTLD